MIYRTSSLALMILGTLIWLLTGCVQFTAPTALIESLRLEHNETGTLAIRIFHLGGLQLLQVGPSGALIFDPEVIHIKNIMGKNGMHVFASSIQNEEGRVLFLAGYPGGSVSDGVILELEVTAVGSPGSRTAIEITRIDLIADRTGNELKDVDLRSGVLTIQTTNSQ